MGPIKSGQESNLHPRDYFRAQGGFSTPQRMTILEEVASSSDHFDAEELIDRLRRKGVRVSRATVYRTIAHLEQGGFIRRIDIDPAHAHYELSSSQSHHEHLVCEQCGRVFEIADPLLEKRIQSAAGSLNFVITRHQVQIFGKCAQCAAEESIQRGAVA